MVSIKIKCILRIIILSVSIKCLKKKKEHKLTTENRLNFANQCLTIYVHRTQWKESNAHIKKNNGLYNGKL